MFGIFFFLCIFSPNIASIARELDDATTTIHHNFEKRQTYETMVSIRNDIAKEGVSLLKGGEELDSVYELRRVWVQHLLIPFTPKGYGWRGSWVTCILRAAFISIRRGFDPRPNLICVPSREQTLFGNERRTRNGSRERLSSISTSPSSYFRRNPSLTQGIRDTVVTSYAYTACIASVGRALWTGSNFPQGVISLRSNSFQLQKWPIWHIYLFILAIGNFWSYNKRINRVHSIP